MSDYTPSLTDEQREAILDWMELPTKPLVYEAVARMLAQVRAEEREQANREPSDADFNRAAQTFYEASGLNLPHTSKPEIVAGVRAAWSALIATQEVRDES